MQNAINGPSGKRSRVLSAGLVLVLLTALVSGVSSFVNFFAVQGANSDAFIAARNTLVAVILVPVAFFAGGGATARLPRRDVGRLALIGLVGGAVPFLLFFRGLQEASASGGAATATFGYRALFIFAAIFAVVALKERVQLRWVAGAALLLAGNFALLSLTAPAWSDGTLLVLAATVLWAGEYTLSKRALKDIAPTTVALGRMGFGALFLLGYLAFTSGFGPVGALSQAQWTWVLLSALLLVAFVTTWYAGLARVDLSVASSVLVLAFPVTWALGAIAGRVPLALPQALGAAAIVLGVVLVVGVAALRDLWRETFIAARAGLRSGA